MKKITTTLILSLLTSTFAFASYEAKSVSQVLKTIQSAKLEYKGHALAFGYASVESCLFVADNLVVIKNYCYPDKKYPARGYTVISPDFGIADIYQEDMGNGLIKRDLRIRTFAEDYKPYAGTALKTITFAKINAIFEELYYKKVSQCWSTNFSNYTEKADYGCTNGKSPENTANLGNWNKETQSTVNQSEAWDSMMSKMTKATTH